MNFLKRLFFRRNLYSDLADEMREHLEEKADELEASGMSRDEALTAARREFGNVTVLEERGREIWQWALPESIFRDLRLAARQLRRNPGFTLTVVLTLALAIGANTAVFSIVNALLIRPLPFPQPERLAGLTRHLTRTLAGGESMEKSDDGQDGETWELVRDHVSAVQATAFSFDSSGVNMEAGNQVRYVQQHRVSADFFDVMGFRPWLGRTFTSEEDRPRGPNAVILSYELWQSVFAGDRDIVGRTIRLKGEPWPVVGVMPPHAQDSVPADLWTPIRPWRNGEGGGDNYQIVMRLRDGATWEQVNTQLRPLQPDILNRVREGEREQLLATPLQQDLAEQKRRPALILMTAVGFILLIAAANLAGLMLVRVSRRRSEIATRLALGAPRAAILRQLFMEPFLLSLSGAVGGLALAFLCRNSFVSVFPSAMLPLGGIQIDGRVIFFTFLCMAGTGLLIGIFPAVAVRATQIRSTLIDRSVSGGGRAGRTRQVLIAAEVSLTLMLLAGSGLLVRTLVYLQTLPSGFDPSNILTAKASLDDLRYQEPAVFQKLVRESLAAMRQIPGVESAAMGLSLPYERGLNDGFKAIDGPNAGNTAMSSSAYVSPDYFRAMRIPVVAGRAFTDDDTAAGAPVVIVNESFAGKHLGTRDVVGLHLALGSTACTIVGLTGDVKKRPGIAGTAPLSGEPVFYIPYTQLDGPSLRIIHTWFEPSWLVRTGGPISGLPNAMQIALGQAGPGLPFAGFHSLDELESLALAQQRVEVLLLTALAGLALIISIVGVYGLVSNVIVQRRREIGIRMALGCTVRQAMAQVAGDGMFAVSLGVVAGLALAVFALRILKSELYGVRSLDPLTLSAVSLLLLLAALVASFAPTLRIARIDPASTLRAE